MLIFAQKALLPDGWVKNVRVKISDGTIVAVETSISPTAQDTIVDTLLPALSNVHSHTFQRAMAGMTEYRAQGRDNFWTWRELMYRFLDCLTPEDIEAIAALAFMEMQEAGYAAVGEFHYVHHQPGGRHYDQIDELSQRIFNAAAQTGIGLTHLPVLYSFGGTGEQALTGGQLRFGNDYGSFERLIAASSSSARDLPSDTLIGVAPHSLRATNPIQMKKISADFHGLPIHIHAAEQPKEVDDTVAWLGARPVEWLLREAGVGQNWCLIHCTHMTEAETAALAKSGAVAGLCPLTESNLGDGIFNGQTYLGHQGAFGLGSDSCIKISVSAELSTLEYSQRLKAIGRNILAVNEGSTGQQLYSRAAAGGAKALGRKSGCIAAGQLADLVAINSNHLALCALSPEQLIDGWVFAGNDSVVTDVWSAGRHCVRNGQHIARDAISSRYRMMIQKLLARL